MKRQFSGQGTGRTSMRMRILILRTHLNTKPGGSDADLLSHSA